MTLKSECFCNEYIHVNNRINGFENEDLTSFSGTSKGCSSLPTTPPCSSYFLSDQAFDTTTEYEILSTCLLIWKHIESVTTTLRKRKLRYLVCFVIMLHRSDRGLARLVFKIALQNFTSSMIIRYVVHTPLSVYRVTYLIPQV